ncbi:sigma-70 family RNA polymerase sigma factor [Mycobacterium sp. 141]|uniref:sigma-70 family RNA polymerase sigma factor n=1 Tax=Mycobacterium sp. 141 TaxID=1120797 RepID=UPI0003A18769|nr:sigma-70 family RNA polymerase sigma factor [Mycobacterium sp. 141]
MTALPDWDAVTDAELACAAAAGDRGAFAGIYDRYADRLYDFCVGMLRDRDGAAECVQEAFCIAADRLPQLRDADKLRPWLYAIARNEALRAIRERSRERVVDQVPEEVSTEPGPEILAVRTELARLVAEATGGLSERDQAVLELTYCHGLDGPELATVLGVSHASANKMTQRLRDTVERSLGALLVSRSARNNPRGCAELAAIIEGWDGAFTVLMRKRIARHIESCPTCDEQRRRLVSPAALLGGVPVFVPAPDWLRDHVLRRIRLTANANATGTPVDRRERSGIVHGGADGSDRGRLSRRLLLSAALVVVLAGGLAVTVVRPGPRNLPVSPANLTQTTAAPRTTSMTASPRTAEAPQRSATASPIMPVVPSSVAASVADTTASTRQPSPAIPSEPPPAAPIESTVPVATPVPPSITPPAPPPATPVVPSAPVAPWRPPLRPIQSPTTGPITPAKPVPIRPPRAPVAPPAIPVTTQPVIG